MTQRSLAEIPESELMRLLLADHLWRRRLIGLHGIPDSARPYPDVPLTGLQARGDIDILAVDPEQPDFATAIQVKRIKVTSTTFQSGKPNKIDALRELKRQSNILAALGFAQIFAFAVIVVDSRSQNKGEYRFDGLTPELNQLIASALSLDGLADRIGFVHYEIVQPLDDTPLSTGTYSGKPLRMPTVVVQPNVVTSWVAKVIAERDAEEAA